MSDLRKPKQNINTNQNSNKDNKEPEKKKTRNPFKLLKQWYNISIKNKNGKQEVVPTENVKDEIKKELYQKEVVFKDRLKELYDYFLMSNVDSADSLKNRVSRYNDLSFMRYNSNVIWRAANMYAFETTQADGQNSTISVIAKDKEVVEYIYKFFDKIGLNKQVITDVAYNLALYGDSFFINCIENNAITKVIPISVFNIKDRIEFNAAHYEEQLAMQQGNFSSYINSDRRLQIINDMLSKENKDYSKFFKSYLFGFKISEDTYIPPWGVTHFRLFSTESEFYPFGRSLFIGALSAFRQLKSFETLQQMARVFNFPTEIFSVNVSDTMSESEMWAKVNQARENYTNLNLVNQGDKESESIGKTVWLAKDKIDFESKSPNINLGDIADIELALKKLVSSTDIPISFLIPDEGGFGTTGISLTQQYKPFARSVYNIQSAILEEVVHLIKTQFLLTGDYPLDTPFELEMRYPVLEETSERQRAKSDNLRLISDMINFIKDVTGIEKETQLPDQIVLDIFSKYSFIDQSDLKRWTDTISKEKQNQEVPQESKFLREKLEKRLNEDVIMEAYFESQKKLRMLEGTKNNTHYMSSCFVNTNKHHDQILMMLDKDFLNKKGKKLKEKENL